MLNGEKKLFTNFNIINIALIRFVIVTGIVIFITALFINSVDTTALGSNVIELVILIVLVNILLLIMIIIARQPTQDIDLAFKVSLPKQTIRTKQLISCLIISIICRCH